LTRTKLFQRNPVDANTGNLNFEVKKKSETFVEKLLTSNFPTSLLKMVHVRFIQDFGCDCVFGKFKLFNEFNLC